MLAPHTGCWSDRHMVPIVLTMTQQNRLGRHGSHSIRVQIGVQAEATPESAGLLKVVDATQPYGFSREAPTYLA